jgi:Fe-S oxidoreductase
MAYIYFPSCKAKAAFTEPSKKLAQYIYHQFHIEPIGCCKVNNPRLIKEDTAIVLCLNCARVIEAYAEYGDIEFVWEIINRDESFVFPDYHGQRMAISDCHLAKDRRNVSEAVRSLMKKMNIEIVELEHNFEQADHCASQEIVGYHRDSPMSAEEQREYFTNRYKDVPADTIVSYCKYCNEGVGMSHKFPKHILELLFP